MKPQAAGGWRPTVVCSGTAVNGATGTFVPEYTETSYDFRGLKCASRRQRARGQLGQSGQVRCGLLSYRHCPSSSTSTARRSVESDVPSQANHAFVSPADTHRVCSRPKLLFPKWGSSRMESFILNHNIRTVYPPMLAATVCEALHHPRLHFIVAEARKAGCCALSAAAGPSLQRSEGLTPQSLKD